MKRVGEVEKAISGEDVRLPRLQFQALKPWAYQCVKEHYELVSTMVTVSRAVLFPEKPFTENEVLDNKTLQTALASAYVDAVDKFNRPNFEYEDWKKRRDEFADKKLQGWLRLWYLTKPTLNNANKLLHQISLIIYSTTPASAFWPFLAYTPWHCVIILTSTALFRRCHETFISVRCIDLRPAVWRTSRDRHVCRPKRVNGPSSRWLANKGSSSSTYQPFHPSVLSAHPTRKCCPET